MLAAHVRGAALRARVPGELEPASGGARVATGAGEPGVSILEPVHID
eukprot:COSAG01_NODE_17_length_39991_cov_30.596160_21_plen_47_part_00